MTKGNPNDPSMKQNFVAKVYDPTAKDYKPLYIAPDATDSVRGDVYLSDAIDRGDNATTGVTAATPFAVREVQQNAETKLSTTIVSQQTVAGPVTFEEGVVGASGFTGNVTGNADTSTALKHSRNITITSGSQSAAAAFDGSADINIALTKVDGSTITGTIPLSAIPAGAQEKLVRVADEAARFALTIDDVQTGDSVLQIDTGVMYVVVDTAYLNTEQGYQEYKAATALESFHADEADVALKLGTTSIAEDGASLMLLNEGVPAQSTASVGNGMHPVYMHHGTLQTTTVSFDDVATDIENALQESKEYAEKLGIPLVTGQSTASVGYYIATIEGWNSLSLAEVTGKVFMFKPDTGYSGTSMHINLNSLGNLRVYNSTQVGMIEGAVQTADPLPGTFEDTATYLMMTVVDGSHICILGSPMPYGGDYFQAPVAISRGGTGGTSVSQSRSALGVGDMSHSDISGALALDHGGTGTTTKDGARAVLGVGDMSHSDISGALALDHGGTGATTLSGAQTSLGIGDLQYVHAGILTPEFGGTGVTTLSELKTELDIGELENTVADLNVTVNDLDNSVIGLDLRLFGVEAKFDQVSGLLPISSGGTGASTASAALNNLAQAGGGIEISAGSISMEYPIALGTTDPPAVGTANTIYIQVEEGAVIPAS